MANEGKIDHYRDSDNLEVDAILRLDDGRYGLIEIKLGSKEGVKEGIKNLAKLKNKVDDTSFASLLSPWSSRRMGLVIKIQLGSTLFQSTC